MISTIKTAIKFFSEQGIHSLNHITPPSALIMPKILSENAFFFTMDDVWEKTSISDLKRLISLLDKHRVKGTFFITPYYGYNALSAEKAKQFKKILGKQEIAMHGIRHNGDLIKISNKERIYELSHCKKFLEKKLKIKIKGYRSPYFLRNRHLLKELASLGFLYNSDQFLFRPYPFVKDEIAVIPCHDKCDPFAMGLNDESILNLVKSKIEYSIKSRKPYVFLMHAYDINEKNIGILSKIFEKAKSKGFIADLSLSDFAFSLDKKKT
jgi:peptidoglycan/xylan/chitin deacetylase (PgdA/CDA1 family)